MFFQKKHRKKTKSGSIYLYFSRSLSCKTIQKILFFLLANFIVLAMFLTALSLVQAIFTLRMFFHTPLQPVPPWVKKWFLDIIGPRLGFSMFIQKTRLRGLSVFQKRECISYKRCPNIYFIMHC